MQKLPPNPDHLERRLAGRSLILAALALTALLPTDGHSQANRERERLRQTHREAPSWLECFAPNECEVRVFVSALHGRKGRLRLLAARAASACQAAGYSHYVAGSPSRVDVGIGSRSVGYRFVQHVYFTHDSAQSARPCSFSATSELEAEAKEMANANGYSWPVGQGSEEAEGWTFESGENDWGEALPDEDVIASPAASALRSDQEDLVGILLLTRDCTAAVGVVQAGVEPEGPWALAEGGADSPDSDLHDRIVEIRVDGARVMAQGQNVIKLTAAMVASTKQTVGVAVRSAEHGDNAAFEWTVADGDRAIIREHFPSCVESP